MDASPYDRIVAAKAALGGDLAILAHHYQGDDVYRHADFAGDSLELSSRIEGLDASSIVFCGVTFMAETAAVLAKPGQNVFIPDPKAGCVLSDMAPAPLVAAVIKRLRAGGRRVIPLTYVNSQAEVKAVCGRYGGSVCTSANARIMVAWALAQGEGVLFLPDQNLARNTCDALGVPAGRRQVLDVFSRGRTIDTARLAGKDVMIWPGQCVIHSRIKPAAIAAFRAEHPGALVVVHPECSPEVVAAADSCGSTSHIIGYCEAAPAGRTVAVGTEINMVARLAKKYAGVKTIVPLMGRGCSNMAKITEEKLARQLDDLDRETPVAVGPDVREPARLALTRMLNACRAAGLR
ncbi:MAG: quinolinate synthase NadA [Desulfovibrionaceae bacterium]|nr:quinolinate synthase NadA [Desulfovibrionaceae bacterium]MBF0515092.1 quinolinate synthase NadA [Desulfovibrionaceae bacterium]